MSKHLVDAWPRCIAEILRRGEGKCAKLKRGVGQQSAREEQVLHFGRAAGAMVRLGARPEVEAEVDRFGSFLHELKNVELDLLRGDAAGGCLSAAAPANGANKEVPRDSVLDRKERNYKQHGESSRVVGMESALPRPAR